MELIERYLEQRTLYDDYRKIVGELINSFLANQGIRPQLITSRVKQIDSLQHKIQRKNYTDLEEITDLSGVRVILYFESEIQKVVEVLKKQFEVYEVINTEDRFRTNPRSLGYRAVHLIVSLNKERLKLDEYKRYQGLKCEVQISSVLEHAWAEIEHDIGYKKSRAQDVEDNDTLFQIEQEFTKTAALIKQADECFSKIKVLHEKYLRDNNQSKGSEKRKHRKLFHEPKPDTEILNGQNHSHL